MRTGIERLDLDEDPKNSGGVFLRDFRTDLDDSDFSTVYVAITVGTGADQDKLTGTAQPVERPLGSGKWRLVAEP